MALNILDTCPRRPAKRARPQVGSSSTRTAGGTNAHTHATTWGHWIVPRLLPLDRLTETLSLVLRFVLMREHVRTVRLQVHMTQEEVRAIDDFWFAQRLLSKAEAVRELLRRGMAATTEADRR